ncbi:MAG: helix-turn-helix transcriptional regulator [Vallitalea sp.]|jgi:AraC-like DNA-binding protein|nr:helix-turn-helix transcriptional regulator [Vallitalea sp.]
MSIIKKKKIYVTWILCHIITIFLSIVVTAFIGYNFNDLMMYEIKKNNELVLNQFKQTVDDEYNQIKELISKTALNPKLIQIINYQKPLSGEQRLNIYELMNDIYIKNNNNNIYIFFDKMDSIITHDNFMNSKDYFENYVNKDVYDYESWLVLMKNKGNNKYLINKDKTIIFTESLPLFGTYKAFGKICVKLDIESIMESILFSNEQISSSLIIVDKDNKTVASTTDYNIDENIYSKLNKSSDVFIKDNSIISYVTSNNKQWKYIYIVNNNIFQQQTKVIIKSIFIVIAFYILISSALVFFINNINYKPIKRIVNTISNNINEVKYNEIDTIKYYVDLMDEKNNKINTFINEQKDLFKEEYIKKLLLGENINYESEILEKIGLDFKTDLFVVALIHIDNTINELLLHGDNNNELGKFIITNIFEEVFNEEDKGNIIYIDGLLIGLINLNNKNKQQLDNKIKQAIIFLKKRYSIEITVVLSNVHKSPYNITLAYKEVLEAIKYKYILNGKIINYEDVISVNYKEKYYYPISVERQLTNFIKSGNYEKAIQVLDNIFEENFERNNLSPKMAKSLVLELSSTIIKIYKDSEIITEEELISEVMELEQLISYSNIPDIKNNINKMIKAYFERMNEFNKKAENDIKYDIQNYITKQIENPDLNITAIADHFSLHPFYLSKIYRKENNESILDTITRIRIEKAKELLKENTVKEVAIKVGYTNTRTFTRGFKKIEGVTPGIYKKQYK